MTRERNPEWRLGWIVQPLGLSLPRIYVQDHPPKKILQTSVTFTISQLENSPKSIASPVENCIARDVAPRPNQGFDPHANRRSPIAKAFFKAASIEWNNRSYGDTEDTSSFRISRISTCEPEEERSKDAVYRHVGLEQIRRDDWGICYTDGIGQNSLVGGAYWAEGAGREVSKVGEFAGVGASVADGERLPMAVGRETDPGAIVLASDSQEAIQLVLAISKGHPPRSGIDSRLKRALEQD
ncbi:hypothetical protein EV426DRAFT_712180 [Tirmania nivea]|nr:hypothetical protein EV426DRAFT_712180 [Tirmania nivea]